MESHAIFAVIVLVILLVAICLFIKCRKAKGGPSRGSTNWRGAAAVRETEPEPAPGHWRPADEMGRRRVSLSLSILDIIIPRPYPLAILPSPPADSTSSAIPDTMNTPVVAPKFVRHP